MEWKWSLTVINWIQVLLDELPMVYAAMQALYCVIAQGKPTTLTLKLGCAFVPLFITVTYLLVPDPIYHQAAYAAITLSTAWKQYALGKTFPRQSSLYKYTLYILKSGVVLEIMAFAIWNFDNLFCERITAWRARVPVSSHSAFQTDYSKNHAVLGGSIEPGSRLVAHTYRLGVKSNHDGVNR